MLVAQHEDNPQSLIHDKFAVALVNSHSVTVGLPKFMSKLAHFFIYHAVHIICEVTVLKEILDRSRAGWSGDFCQNGLSQTQTKE